MSLEIVPAARLPHEERAALWTEAFSDYFTPGVITVDTLKAMETLFDLEREASRVVVEDGRPVAFAMLGVRGPARSGPLEARRGGPGGRGWIGGMGVIPAARRRGHGDRVMRAVLDAARERGLATVRLEVLVQNDPAIPLYERLGFRTLRQVEVWERAAEAPAPVDPGSTGELSLDDAMTLLGERRIEDIPWQRELGAARRVLADLAAVASASDGARAVAVHRTLPDRVSLVAIGVEPETEPAAGRALDALLAGFFAARSGRPARLLNLPANDPAAPALERIGAKVTHRQWEMELAV